MKLSILMPVYNERTVVERCISQVLTAPLPESMDRELVIVDDCSTDGTYNILERLAAGFPQIRHQGFLPWAGAPETGVPGVLAGAVFLGAVLAAAGVFSVNNSGT